MYTFVLPDAVIAVKLLTVLVSVIVEPFPETLSLEQENNDIVALITAIDNPLFITMI